MTTYLKDEVKWKDKNSGVVREGVVHSILDNDIVGIGQHYVSYMKTEDVEILEVNHVSKSVYKNINRKKF